jgi:acetyl esterase/lipase
VERTSRNPESLQPKEKIMPSIRYRQVTAVVLVALCAGTVPATFGAAAEKTLQDKRQSDAPWAEEVKVRPDVVYGHKDGMALTLDLFQPGVDANGAGVLFLVSGGWFSHWAPPDKMQGFVKPLTDKGFTVFAVRHGSSPRYSLPEIVEDVRRSVRYVRLHAMEYGVDPNRLGVYGMSAGGHLSLLLGTASDNGDADSEDPVLRVSDRVRAVVAWVPPTDLRTMVWKSPESLPAYKNYPALDLPLDQAAKVSPLVHVTPDDPPSLVLSGAKDNLVPIKHSEEIRDAFEAQHVPNRLIVFENSGHGFQKEDQQKAMREMANWFEKHLLEKQKAE